MMTIFFPFPSFPHLIWYEIRIRFKSNGLLEDGIEIRWTELKIGWETTTAGINLVPSVYGVGYWIVFIATLGFCLMSTCILNGLMITTCSWIFVYNKFVIYGNPYAMRSRPTNSVSQSINKFSRVGNVSNLKCLEFWPAINQKVFSRIQKK